MLNKLNRHLARTIVMQVLYEWDFRGQDVTRLPDLIAYVRAEFAPDIDDGGYVERQVQAVVAHRAEIDELLEHFAPHWNMQTMTAVDRNILRLGAYELRYDEEIPSRAAINEAIELGKAFGGDASGKFVNGVLGAIYKDMLTQQILKKADAEEKEKTESPA